MKNIFIIAVMLLASAAIPLRAQEWKLAKDAKGIQVYTRSVPGSDFKAVRAEMKIKTSIPSLIALMTDFDSFPKWYPRMKNFTCVKEINKLEYYIHIVIDAPWPAKDRDSISHFKIRQNPADKIVTIEFTDVPGIMKEEPGMVRVKNLYGIFRFAPEEDGMVKVTYETHSDPGGKLPAWMSNATTTDRPYRIFRNMREMVIREEYQNRICEIYAEIQAAN